MDKKDFFSVALVILLGAFGSASAQKTTKAGPRFLDDIEVGFGTTATESINHKSSKSSEVINSEKRNEHFSPENATAVQLKYALLLDTEIEAIENISLFSVIDEWYGTPYRLGGTSKNGIDCSALMQLIFSIQYSITIPRTAREQYAAAQRISANELRQGDLLFFNTRGGVSHVGMYLQNNKFVHAASSGGVMISDMDDAYWVKRFIGAGRVEGATTNTFFSQP